MRHCGRYSATGSPLATGHDPQSLRSSSSASSRNASLARLMSGQDVQAGMIVYAWLVGALAQLDVRNRQLERSPEYKPARR